MAKRLAFILLFLAGICSGSFASPASPGKTGEYEHPLLKVAWTVIVEEEKVILTGVLRNTSQAEIKNVELIARALFADRSEQGQERFLFIPKRLGVGESRPFGMFFRVRDNRLPVEIEGIVCLEREGLSMGGVEQEFFNFTAIVPHK